MSIEDYVGTNRGVVVAGPECFPDSVMARIQELEDAYPDVVPQLAGGLAELFEDEGSDIGPYP